MRRGRAGVNMLEAILACFLLTLVVAYSAAVWSIHARAVGKSRYAVLGLFLARQRLEEAVYKGFSAQEEETAGITTNITTTVNGNPSVVAFTYYCYVDPPPAVNPPDLLRTVQVRVTWKDPNGNDREVRLETQIAGKAE
ncbi:hypothetical protein DYH09_15325 [bacterium CPR1]|nr:hypothetical protein [bacterium CPR1]